MIGEDGGYNGANYFPYNFALTLIIVTTNVVVLCENLSQEFPLRRTIKSYCIVSGDTHLQLPDDGLHELDHLAPVVWAPRLVVVTNRPGMVNDKGHIH